MTKLKWEDAELKTPKTRSEQVYDLLRERILNQKIKPGEVLMEVAVSEAIGVSRTPVREAFRLLEYEKLVTRNPKGGVLVTELTLEELKEVSDLRLVFETYSIELACERITQDDIAKLEATAKEADEIFANSNHGKEIDLLRLGTLNTSFHDILYKAVGSDYLNRILEIIRLPILRYRPFSLKTKKQRERSWEEHKMIINLLKDRDKKGLTKLIKKHIKDAGNAVAKKLDNL